MAFIDFAPGTVAMRGTDGRHSAQPWIVALTLCAAGCTSVPIRGTAAKPVPEARRADSELAQSEDREPLGHDRRLSLRESTSFRGAKGDNLDHDETEATSAPQLPQSKPHAAAKRQNSRQPSQPEPPVQQASGEESEVGAAETEVLPAVEATAEEVAAPGALPPTVYTLSLANVLYLADAQNPNVAVARERINEAYARVDRSETLWLPSIRAGLNYNHHEGNIQDVAGTVFETNRSSFYGGFGANAVGAGSPAVPGLAAQFHLTDAIFQPKIATHQAASRQFGATAARNDVLRDAAVAYLELLRAEQALAIAQEALDHTQKLEDLTRQYAETGQGLQSDQQRMAAEVAVREDQLLSQHEAVAVASARLAQLLHADPSVQIASGEPLTVPLDVLEVENGAAEYVATGLSRRPELAEQKHLVCEAVERLRREKYAPLVPSVLLGLSYGGLGGGLGNSIINTNDRWDADAVAYWEVRNLGAGERAARSEASSMMRQAQHRELAVLDRIAREVVEAHAQVGQRRQRIGVAKRGITAAERSYALNLQRIENGQGLPIETLQAIQALATARRSYLNAVVDYNVAQFELCRAIGWFEDG